MSLLPSRFSDILPFLKQSPVAHGLSIRLLAIGLAFIQAILLARITPPDVYGAYSVGMSFATVLGVVSCLGLAQLSVRSIPKLHSAEGAGDLRTYIRQTSAVVLLASLVIAIGCVLTLLLLPPLGSGIIREALLLCSALIPLFALMRMASAQLRGFRAPTLSQLVEALIRPLVFVPGLAIVAFSSAAVSLSLLVMISLFATLFALIVGAALVVRKHHFVPATREVVPPIRTHLTGGLPFFLSSLALIAQTELPTLILGAIAGATEAGLLQPVLRIGLVLAIGHIVVAHPLAPRISSLWHQNDRRALRDVSVAAAKKSFLITFPLCLFTIFFSETILSIFGERFIAAAPGLIAIAVAQIINSLTGYGDILLSMTAYQHYAVLIQLASLAVMVTLATSLAGTLGAMGVAYAFAVGIVLVKILYLILAKYLLRINPSLYL